MTVERARLTAALAERGFVLLGWFAPEPQDDVPPLPTGKMARLCLIVGNAGPAMFARFMRGRKANSRLLSLDDWTRATLTPLAQTLGARIVFPFDKPHAPFLTWGQRAGCGFASPLGLNIHPHYGLWHSYRAALIFEEFGDFSPGAPFVVHPCQNCPAKPCLSACPVEAFGTDGFNRDLCLSHLATGADCNAMGCRARRACPIGAAYRHDSAQTQFHMQAFRKLQTPIKPS